MHQSFSHAAVARSIFLAVLISTCPGSRVRAVEGIAAEQLVTIEVQLVDGDGKPVEGAEVGDFAAFGNYVHSAEAWTFGDIGNSIAKRAAKQGTEWWYEDHVRSVANGVANLSIATYKLDRLSLIARHEGRKIASLVKVDRKQLGQPVRITLLPECEIVGEAVCSALSREMFESGGILIYVHIDNRRPLEFVFDKPKFRVPLPPGKYTFEVSGAATHTTNPAIVVASGQRQQRVEPVQLQPNEWARLVGKLAPEIPDVVAWKNSSPITLVDLQGKVVVLDFWGYWCGSCVVGMPELFELHDKYHDQGFEVIGIHEDLGEDETEPVDTVARLDRRLAKTRQGLWKGRDLPFPVALVVGRRTAYAEGVVGQASSAASARFGITSYPTQLLIDRQGKIVGQFIPDEKGIALLEKTLAEK